MSTFETNVTLVEEWKLLYENKSKKVRKNSDQILLFSSLDLAAQGYIAKMTDENMSQITTLENFVSSLSASTLRVDPLNDHDYIIPEKFVFYEKTVIPHWTSDKEQTYQTTVTSNYAQVPIVFDWAKEWSDKADGKYLRNENFIGGNKYEELITEALLAEREGGEEDGEVILNKNGVPQLPNNAIVSSLRQVVPDLDERYIFSQVQFCINDSENCGDEGTYFKADLVLMHKDYGTDENEDDFKDMIICDIKYRSSSPFTSNQKLSCKTVVFES